MVLRTTWEKSRPEAFSTAPRFFITCSAWSTTSPWTMFIVFGSSGIWPERKVIFPASTCTACE
jgi:hypothetical protein